MPRRLTATYAHGDRIASGAASGAGPSMSGADRWCLTALRVSSRRLDADAVHAFLRRDRSATEDLKRRHWAERFRAEGSAATLAASSALREHARRVRPDWPTDADVTIEDVDVPSRALVPALERAGFSLRVPDDFVDRTRVIPIAHDATGGIPIEPRPCRAAAPGALLRARARASDRGRRRTGRKCGGHRGDEGPAGRPKDMDDVRTVLAANAQIDVGLIRTTLGELETILDQADLLPAFDDALARARR